MDKEKVFNQLREASLKEQNELSDTNLFKEIGFDGGKGRLGWFRKPEWKDIETSLGAFLKEAEGKDEFIFVGMGGSVNGVKTLIALTGAENIHALDSLDTKAIEALLGKVSDLKKTLVVAISKSGTTKETQLLARSMRQALGDKSKNNILWIADKGAFARLEASGWQDEKKISIQPDGKEDIGGRFTSPHTLIFLAPLVITLGRDMESLNKFWQEYIAFSRTLEDKAFSDALRCSKESHAKFSVEVRNKILGGIDNWIIQLFQESLGSKIEGFYPKTLVCGEGKGLKGFNLLKLDIDTRDALVYTAALMYYLQVFTALLSYLKKINFIDQPYVEVYKKELKSLEDKEIETAESISLEDLAFLAEEKSKDKEFVDCVLYFQADKAFKESLSRALAARLKGKYISIFEGSDWNHHSYQAAFKDPLTLFVILTLKDYRGSSEYIGGDQIGTNLKVLKAISYATYLTIKDKALYKSLT